MSREASGLSLRVREMPLHFIGSPYPPVALDSERWLSGR